MSFENAILKQSDLKFQNTQNNEIKTFFLFRNFISKKFILHVPAFLSVTAYNKINIKISKKYINMLRGKKLTKTFSK